LAQSTSEASSQRAAFARQVRDALAHLYDPVYLQTHPLVRLVAPATAGRSSGVGTSLRQLLLDAIESLQPLAGTPTTLPSGSSHQILVLRYVEGLDVPAVQLRLALGKSEYYREQQRGLDAVVSLLWERWTGGPLPARETTPAGSRANAPAAEVSERAPHDNLPLPTTRFVEPAGALAQVKQRLAESRLLTLTGAGGCGKTRLAIETAREVMDTFPDGVWLVELAPLTDPTLVPQTVANALGLREASGRPILDTLIGYLRRRALMLVLDNCEHLIDACARLIETLLRSCAQLQILATSRELLGIGGEAVWRVPSLTAVDPTSLGGTGAAVVETVLAAEAVPLFVDRARLLAPGFGVTGDNARLLARVCRRLDGIPLAIELAAARLPALSLEQIAARLDQRFRLLTGGSRTALRRQQTLRATIDWSYDLLAEEERVLLRRLAVFAGGWTLEAAEAVCGEGVGDQVSSVGASPPRPGSLTPDTRDPTSASDVADVLARLAGKSMVLVEGNGEEARYRLLETVHQYAEEKLIDAGEAEPLRDRHRDWYAALAERSEPGQRGPRQEEWRDRLEAELDNMRAALAWGLEGDLEVSARLAGSLARFWMMFGNQTEGLAWLKAILARDRAARSLSRRVRASVLLWTTLLGMDQGDLGMAREPLEESLALYRELGDTPGIIHALRELGLCLVLQGELGDQTRAILEESLQLARAEGDQRSMGLALDRLAILANYRKDYRQAREALMEARGYYLGLGDVWAEAGSLMIGGLIALTHEDLERARQELDIGLAVARRVRDRFKEGQIIILLTRLARQEGDDHQVEALLKSNLRLLVENGSPDLRNDALCSLAELAVRQGKPARGVLLFAAASSWDPVSRDVWLRLDLSVQANRDMALATARAALGESAFAAAWAEGKAMTPEQALEYALAEEAD
jgi:non-specific serine/threonine protein kinase